MGSIPRAPLRTGGFYGTYNRRGRAELKVCDVSGSNVTSLAAGALTLLNGISQGTDYTNRIGRKIMMKSLLFRFSIFPNTAASSPQGNIVRVLLVCDLQANAAAAIPADVLQTVDYQSPLNLNNRDRFKIFWDKFLMLEANYYPAFILTAGSPSAHMRQIYKKMNIEVINVGTGATIGSIQTGALYVLVISKVDGTVYDFNSRVRFLDS